MISQLSLGASVLLLGIFGLVWCSVPQHTIQHSIHAHYTVEDYTSQGRQLEPVFPPHPLVKDWVIRAYVVKLMAARPGDANKDGWGTLTPPPTVHFQKGENGALDVKREPPPPSLHSEGKEDTHYLVFSFRVAATAALKHPKKVDPDAIRRAQPASDHTWVYHLGVDQRVVAEEDFEWMVDKVADHIRDEDVKRYMNIEDYFEGTRSNFEKRLQAWRGQMQQVGIGGRRTLSTLKLRPDDLVHREESCGPIRKRIDQASSQPLDSGPDSVVTRESIVDRKDTDVNKTTTTVSKLAVSNHGRSRNLPVEAALLKESKVPSGTYALKLIDKKKKKNSALLRLETEKLLLYAMGDDCEQLVQAQYICEWSTTQTAIFMPYLGGGPASEMICDNNKSCRWSTQIARQQLWPRVTRELLADVAIALGYMHDKGLMHRDLKLENVVFHYDDDGGKGGFRLIDYGFSEFETNEPRNTIGTPTYMAPEVIKTGHLEMKEEPPQTRAVDVWAFGIMIATWVEEKLPFEELMRDSNREWILDIHKTFLEILATKDREILLGSENWRYMPELKSLTKRLLTYDPTKRMEVFKEIFLEEKEPFFEGHYIKKRFAGLVRSALQMNKSPVG